MVQKTNIFRMAEDFDTSFEGQEYSTFHLPNSFLISSKYGRGASADDAVDVKVFRYADYSGGTAYETNIALQVQTSAGAGGETFEWAGLYVLDNYRVAADASQDVALYTQAIKNATGATWAFSTELRDLGGANPVLGSVNTELASSATGTDNNDARVMLHIIPSSGDGNAAEWGLGINITPGANMLLKKGINFDGDFTKLLNYTGIFEVDGDGETYIQNIIRTSRASASAVDTHGLDLMIDGVSHAKIHTPSSGVARIALGAGGLDISSTYIRPRTDNTHAGGGGSNRYTELFAATGTVNTSDALEKTPLVSLNDGERAAIRRVMAGIGRFQRLDAVEAKGADRARLHIGVTVQDVIAAFEAEGLDAWRYGAVCRDPIMGDVTTEEETDVPESYWADKVDADGNVVMVAANVLEDVPKKVRTPQGTAVLLGEDGKPQTEKIKKRIMVPAQERVTRMVKRMVPVTRQVQKTIDGEPQWRLGLREGQLFWLAFAAMNDGVERPAPTPAPTESAANPLETQLSEALSALEAERQRSADQAARISELEAREPEIREVEKIVERVVEVPAAVVEAEAPEPYTPDFTLIPDALARFAAADETAADFRARLKSLWQRFGIEDGKNFPGGGEPLTGAEKITMREIDIVLNSDEGKSAGLLDWLRAEERP